MKLFEELLFASLFVDTYKALEMILDVSVWVTHHQALLAHWEAMGSLPTMWWLSLMQTLCLSGDLAINDALCVRTPVYWYFKENTTFRVTKSLSFTFSVISMLILKDGICIHNYKSKEDTNCTILLSSKKDRLHIKHTHWANTLIFLMKFKFDFVFVMVCWLTHWQYP